MGSIRIVENRCANIGQAEFPTFYMNDFSVLGIVVHQLEQAVSVLRERGYLVREERGLNRVTFKDNQQLQQILAELAGRKVEYSLSDLVGCAYQG
ncbi:hypothetical protein [Desulfogranum mediterraneum]|uniref:hypothetical protein n=1 Tax=Desulfogranum mediterraneum TaxID=160661 RepID=UPI00040A5ADE|nr:hypothetical protein [Desulfogranum mediterraneum]